MAEDYLSKIKEADETIARIEREELQDFIIDQIDERFNELLKSHDLTEQQEQQLARIANYSVAVRNAKEAIASLKGIIALVFACVSLILLFTAGWWWYTTKYYDSFYNNLYKAKYDKALSEYIEQSRKCSIATKHDRHSKIYYTPTR